jgi:Ca2+-binding RTX toxin-like protein
MTEFSNFLDFLPAIVVYDPGNPNQFQQWVGSVERGGSRAITYSFSTTAPAQLIAIVQQAFSEISSFTNITFVRVADQSELTNLTNYFDNPNVLADRNPDIRISFQTDGSRSGGFSQFGWWYNGANELIDIDSFSQIWTVNSYTVIHELGHVLGLEHTTPGAAPDVPPYLPIANRTNNYSVMHYILDGSTNVTNAFDGEWDYRHFQLYDVYALQQRFGINITTNSGSNVHTAASLGANEWLQILWDAGGIDTIDMSSETRSQRINLTEGGFSNLGFISGNNPLGDNIAIGLGVQIENAIGGSGNDQLFGNGLSNRLEGGLGADTIYGYGGDDTLVGGVGSANSLVGGAGNDVYVLSAVGDSIVELLNEGIDRVETSLSVYTLAPNVENLLYTGTSLPFLGLGNSADNIITGGVGRDELYGRDGNDTLSDGGGGNGNEDTMLGGLGNDVYVVFVRGTSTIENFSEGVDEVRTTFAIYGLQANIENLTFIDNATHGAGVGNTLNNVITGGVGTDDLFGREGNDTLLGGSGNANTLLGQEGDDLYIVQAVGDSVVEFFAQGTDTVQIALPVFTLPPNVENLSYTGIGTFTGIGNSDANVLIGGSNGDFLSGLDGNDIITGGAGADTLLGGNGSDQFRYVGNDGVDTVSGFQSGIDRFALANAFFGHTATVNFVQGINPTSANANSTFLYSSSTGIVSYDADGNGTSAALQLASIGTGLTLSASDFVFY